MERITTKEIKGSWFGEDTYGLYKDGFLGSAEYHYNQLQRIRREKELLRVQMEIAEKKKKTEINRESREDSAEDRSMERANTMGEKDSWLGEDRVGQNSNEDAGGDCRKRKQDEQFPKKREADRRLTEEETKSMVKKEWIGEQKMADKTQSEIDSDLCRSECDSDEYGY